MDNTTLVSFPLPMATALLCAVIAVLILRLDLGARRANLLFSLFFGIGALASLLIGIRFGYGIDALIPLQRLLPLYIGPLMYLGFVSLTVETRRLIKMAFLHMGAPVAVMASFMLFARDMRALDLVIVASYAAYSFALYLLWRKGPDALIFARIDAAQSLSNWLLRAIGFMVFILCLDGVIAIDFAINQGANASKLISYGNIPLVLILLVTLITLPLIFNRAPAKAPAAPVAGNQDTEVLVKLDNLMKDQQVFLDPNITVQRLAKRLSLPSRSLSGAINRSHGMNISQYVNTFRLAYAAEQLTRTNQSVTSIAAQSGFMARSNFYREFKRVYGQSPVEYRATQTADMNTASN